MPPRKTDAPKPKKSADLPEQLPQPEVLLGCFYTWMAAAFTDRPAEVEALLRAKLPAELPAEKKRAAARPMTNKIGIVRWSQTHETLWFRQGNGAPYRVHPSRLTDAQRAQVATLEPKGKLRVGHVAGRAPLASE